MELINAIRRYSYVLVFVAFCFGATGCTSYVRMSGRRMFPKHPTSFEVQPGGPYPATEWIDFNAVYCCKTTNAYTGLTDYDFIRFWPNGRATQGVTTGRVPTREDIEDFENSGQVRMTIGYYQINGSEVLIEWFGYQSAAMFFPDVGFTREWARTVGDEIVFYKWKHRELGARTFDCDAHFKRVHMDGLNRQPDW